MIARLLQTGRRLLRAELATPEAPAPFAPEPLPVAAPALPAGPVQPRVLLIIHNPPVASACLRRAGRGRQAGAASPRS